MEQEMIRPTTEEDKNLGYKVGIPRSKIEVEWMSFNDHLKEICVVHSDIFQVNIKTHSLYHDFPPGDTGFIKWFAP